MNKLNQNNSGNDSLVINKKYNKYFQRLEMFLLCLLRKKPINFYDIVCQAKGAFPTDVLYILQKLVLSNKLKQKDELYYIKGLKYESKEKDTLKFKNSPLSPNKKVTSKLLSSDHVFADPHLADYDWRFTSEARDELIKRLISFIEYDSKIALFGTPTLFLNIYRLGTHVTLYDNSFSIISDLKTLGFSKGLIHHNLFDPLLDSKSKYEIIVADPPWYTPFHNAFILRSSESLRDQGILMLSVPSWLTRPNVISGRLKIITFSAKVGLDLHEIVPGALLYESPKFEKIALSQKGINLGNWRFGDLFIFRKVREIQQPLKVCYPKDEPNWDEYRFGNIKVKLRQSPKNTDTGELKIRPVSSEGPYLGTVSRRSPLRKHIDLWTSDNIAYSINRIDVIKVALDKLQSGEPLKNITSFLTKTVKISKIKVDKLLKLLTDIIIPYENKEL